MVLSFQYEPRGSLCLHRTPTLLFDASRGPFHGATDTIIMVVRIGKATPATLKPGGPHVLHITSMTSSAFPRNVSSITTRPHRGCRALANRRHRWSANGSSLIMSNFRALRHDTSAGVSVASGAFRFILLRPQFSAAEAVAYVAVGGLTRPVLSPPVPRCRRRPRWPLRRGAGPSPGCPGIPCGRTPRGSNHSAPRGGSRGVHH